MPLYIENATVETTVIDENMPLTEAQVEKLVKLIMQRISTQERDQQSRRSATKLRNESTPDAGER